MVTAIGAGVSMSFAGGLSDTGDFTGRGNPLTRGAITGLGTFLGGVPHTLPFLISTYLTALAVAAGVVAFELVLLPVIVSGPRRHAWRPARRTAHAPTPGT